MGAHEHPFRWPRLVFAGAILTILVLVAVPANAAFDGPPAGESHDAAQAKTVSRDHAPDKAVQAIFNAIGPAAVFLLLVAAGVGLHLPEDLIIIPAGWEVGTGNFPLGWTVLAAYAGVAGGDTGWFLLCRRWGPKLLFKRWFLKSVHPRRILTLKELLDRHGLWVLLISRFIPGARTASVAVAGLTHLKWRIFLAVELPMAATTVAFQIGIGYFAAIGILHSSPTWHWVTIWVGIGVLAAGVIAIAIAWRHMVKNHIRLPRARAAWLREVRGGSRAAMRRKAALKAGS
jgi:membrane-associated protein